MHFAVSLQKVLDIQNNLAIQISAALIAQLCLSQ